MPYYDPDGSVPTEAELQAQQGNGQAIVNGVNNLGQLQQQYNQSRAPGVAAGQMVAGSQAGLDSVNNLYGQTSGLTTPFIQAGAGVGNAIQANTNPYIGAGQQAIGSLQGLQSPLNVNQFYDPSAAFTMQNAMKQAQASQAARGGLLSGAALKDLTSYASGLASQNYQNATQNAFTNRTQQANIGNQLYQGGLAGINAQQPIYQGGISALNIQAQNAGNTANNTAQLYQNIGQAQAGGTVQGANGPSDLQQVGTAVELGKNIYDIYNNISSETAKEAIEDLTPAEVNASLNGMQGKTYEYKPEVQREHGAPSGRQVGVIAEDVQKTPAKSMVNDTDPLSIDVRKASSFSLAALAALNKRLSKLEGKK